jgi:hypothetical protein
MVLRWLPVTDNRALDGAEAALGDSPVKAVLRSKVRAGVARQAVARG